MALVISGNVAKLQTAVVVIIPVTTERPDGFDTRDL